MRVAVTGARGWLARSVYFAAERLKSDGFNLTVEFFSRKEGFVDLVDNSRYLAHSHRELNPSRFDLFIPLAFLTREKYKSLGRDKYCEWNEKIIQNDIEFLQGMNLARVLIMSSGVVQKMSESQKRDSSYLEYANLKSFQENVFRQITSKQNFNICYLYSCTSEDLIKTEGYAFSSIVGSALQNNPIVIENSNSVLRKYVDLRELFYAMLKQILLGGNIDISSGGELIEIGELAKSVVHVLASKSTITRVRDSILSPSDDYFSEDLSMELLFKEVNLKMSPIEAQILNTKNGIEKSKLVTSAFNQTL